MDLFHLDHDSMGRRFSDVYTDVRLRIRPHHVPSLELAYQLFAIRQDQLSLERSDCIKD